MVGHPELIEQQVGQSIRGMKTIPIVLNAMPFCLPNQRRGVYVSDSAALGKLFEGYFSIKQQLTRPEKDLTVEHIIYKFWKEESPLPEDLVRNLAAPIHLRSEWAQWYLKPMEIKLSESMVIKLDALRREEPSFEGALSAMGNDDQKIELIKATMDALWKSQSP